MNRRQALLRGVLYETDPSMRYGTEEVWFAAALYVADWEQDFHELMLNDHIRMVAYENAVKRLVQPGLTVVDVGTGTGILAQWALEAGARTVHAIDMNENMIAEARARLSHSGYSDGVRLHRALSYEVTLPERVDVVMSEILGNLGDNEGMTPILNDARARFLKEGGHMLPWRASAFFVPVSAVHAHRQVQEYRCRGLSSRYDLSSLLRRLEVKNPFHIYYDAIIPTRTHLAPPATATRFAFGGNDRDDYARELLFTIQEDGLLTGFKGYFIAELVDGVVLDISGDNIEGRKTSDSWKHCYLPIEQAVEVRMGDLVEVTYRRHPPAPKDSPFRQRLSWTGFVRRATS